MEFHFVLHRNIRGLRIFYWAIQSFLDFLRIVKARRPWGVGVVFLALAAGAHGFFGRGEELLIDCLGQCLAVDALFFFVKIQQSHKLRAIYAFIHMLGRLSLCRCREGSSHLGNKKAG